MRALLRRLHSAPALVFYGTFMLNLSIAWFNYSTYRFWNFDLAWQTQVVSDYSQLQWPIVTMIGEAASDAELDEQTKAIAARLGL